MYDKKMLVRKREIQGWGVEERGAYIERSESYLVKINSNIRTENKKTSGRPGCPSCSC